MEKIDSLIKLLKDKGYSSYLEECRGIKSVSWLLEVSKHPE